jgi:2-succinyl-5-enolpyruvyl-6-hydroxy-3-cyclohexene-1-carboxylate synthase
VFGTPHGVSFAEVARGYGVEHTHADDVDGFAEAALAPPKGLRLVEVRTDRNANAELHRRLTAAAAAAVSRPSGA